MNEQDRHRLHLGARSFAIDLSDSQLEQFSGYGNQLEEWNQRINLTRVPPEDFVTLHYLDSLALHAARPLRGSERLIDVGTGAGFPGLPLKIAFPDLQVTLLDSTRKRLRFLEEVIANLNLRHVTVVHSRAEAAGRLPDHRERYDLAVARAVAPMPRLVEWLLPFVRLGGGAIALKSTDIELEAGSASKIVRILGGGPVDLFLVTLPGSNIQRKIAIIGKRSQTPSLYPRLGSIAATPPNRKRADRSR